MKNVESFKDILPLLLSSGFLSMLLTYVVAKIIFSSIALAAIIYGCPFILFGFLGLYFIETFLKTQWIRLAIYGVILLCIQIYWLTLHLNNPHFDLTAFRVGRFYIFGLPFFQVSFYLLLQKFRHHFGL